MKSTNAKCTARPRNARYFPAELGARHQLVFDEEVDIFFGILRARWNKIVPPRVKTLPDSTKQESPNFKLYDDPQKAGLTILEKRVSAQHARRQRLHWSSNDYGRERTEIADRIGRLEMDGQTGWANKGLIPVTFSQVVQAGDDAGRAEGRKLAILPEQDSAVNEFLLSEHEIVVDSLSRTFKDFQYPYQEYTPKLTVGRVFRSAKPEQIARCVTGLQAMLPLTFYVEPVAFFPDQGQQVASTLDVEQRHGA
jgi:hypothetical protein